MKNGLWPIGFLVMTGVGVAVALHFSEPSRQPARPVKVAARPPSPATANGGTSSSDVPPVTAPADDPAAKPPENAAGVRAKPLAAEPNAGAVQSAPPKPEQTPIPSSPLAGAPPQRNSAPEKQPAGPKVPAPPDQPPAEEPLVPLPLARSALTMVGADPEAEAVWYDAINDPTLSRNARKDLIEDLNEEGFEDPKRLTEDDVPLILRRLAIIEELAPDAMDEVNAAAFEEAYKDLVKMLEKATSM